MVAPHRHVGALAELTEDEVLEIHRLAVAGVEALGRLYGPVASISAGTSATSPGPGSPTTSISTSSRAGRGHELHAGPGRREGDPGAPARDARPSREAWPSD